MTMYYATWKAHGQTYQTKDHETLAACERDVFGRAYAPTRNSVRFWQVARDSTA